MRWPGHRRATRPASRSGTVSQPPLRAASSSSLAILSARGAARRWSATAAAMAMALAWGCSRSRATSSSAAVLIGWQHRPSRQASGAVSGPCTRSTSAPRSRAAWARQSPISPVLGLVRQRAGSSGSRVGPALTSRRRPRQSRRQPHTARDSRPSSSRSGSAMRPSPIRSQASRPLAGGRVTTRSQLCRVCQLAATPGELHMAVFMAGATSTGASQASSTEATRVSPSPCTQRPRVVALRGASSTSSAHSASST